MVVLLNLVSFIIYIDYYLSNSFYIFILGSILKNSNIRNFIGKILDFIKFEWIVIWFLDFFMSIDIIISIFVSLGFLSNFYFIN